MEHRLPDDNYYEERPVAHTAQGDLYAGIPCTHVVPLHVDGNERGARKRPSAVGEGQPDYTELTFPTDALALVCNYTCNFVAQPPGTQGYAHPYRLVAPVVPLAALVSRSGLAKGEARRIRNNGGLAGLMYLPAPPGLLQDTDDGDEFANCLVACLYRMTSVDQAVLDQRERVARLSKQAQQILICRLIQTVSPNFPEPGDENLVEPDLSCSWSTPAEPLPDSVTHPGPL